MNRAKTPQADINDPDVKLVAINVRHIPFQIRNQYKALCSLKGASMHEEVLRFMKISVADQQLLTDTDYALRVEALAEINARGDD